MRTGQEAVAHKDKLETPDKPSDRQSRRQPWRLSMRSDTLRSTQVRRHASCDPAPVLLLNATLSEPQV